MSDWVWWVTMWANLVLLAFNLWQLIRLGRYQRAQRRKFDILLADFAEKTKAVLERGADRGRV